MLTSIPLLAMAGAAMALIVTRASSRGQAAYAKAATVVEQTIGSIRTVKLKHIYKFQNNLELIVAS